MKRLLRHMLYMVRCVPLYVKYKRFTMINPVAYIENLALVINTLREPSLKSGAVIECGTWRGGMSAGLVEVAGHHRRYIFFDSFEGLPPAQEVDGDAARSWQADTSSPHYFNNCTASVDEFESTLALTGAPRGNFEIRKGYFAETLHSFHSPNVAVLRLDGDWYESTMECLSKFWDSVMRDGIIIVDDYYTWEGCSRAVHDFLAKRQARERVNQGPIAGVAYIVKR